MSLNPTLRSLLSTAVLTFSGLSLHAQDAYIQNVSLPRYIKAGVDYDLSLHVRNNGPGYLPSFSVRWRLDNGPWNNGSMVNITPPGLSTGGYYMPHTHSTPLNTTEGVHSLELNVVGTGDQNAANNSVIIPFTALTTWAPKVVLLEARTETWCPQCPPSNTLTNTLMLDPDFAVVKFHLSDALNDCPECITYYNQHNITYTPAGIIEMGEYGGYAISSYYSLWESTMTSRAAGVSPVQLTMTNSVNTNTRVLSVTLTANFTYAVAGPHRLNVYVAEDNVPGPQQNAPANYIHNKVMRAMLGGIDGTSGVVPDAPVVGTPYSQTYTWTVPAGFDLGHLQLVGVIEHIPGGFNDRYSLNCVKSAAGNVGISDLALGDGALSAWPNPFDHTLYLSVSELAGPGTLQVIGLDGRTVLEQRVVLDQLRTAGIDLGAIGLPKGAYLLRVTTAQGTAERRIVKVD